MPYLHRVQDSKARDLIYAVVEPEQFDRDLEAIVAEVFNRVCGEQLVPGTIFLKSSTDDAGMPGNLALVVWAYENPMRVNQKEELELQIGNDIIDYLEEKGVDDDELWVQVDVVLNYGTSPS